MVDNCSGKFMKIPEPLVYRGTSPKNPFRPPRTGCIPSGFVINLRGPVLLKIMLKSIGWPSIMIFSFWIMLKTVLEPLRPHSTKNVKAGAADFRGNFTWRRGSDASIVTDPAWEIYRKDAGQMSTSIMEVTQIRSRMQGKWVGSVV